MLCATLLLLAGESQIFDGKSLKGWEVVGGGKWTVEDGGVLKGTCALADEQGVLVWEKPVKDFTARLQFRISGGNSGFYFRTERIKKILPLPEAVHAIRVAGYWGEYASAELEA